MTVQPAVEMWSETRSRLSSDDGITKRAMIFTMFQIIHDATDLPENILIATDLPQLMDRYPGTTQIRVTDKDHKQVSPVFSLVGVTYEGEFGPSGASSSPVEKPPEIDWDNIPSEEEIDEDRFGNPLETPNGEPIHGLTETFHDWVYRIRRNYLSVNLAAWHVYLHSVNSDSIITDVGNFAPGLGRLVAFKPKLVFDKDVVGGSYYSVSAAVKFRYPYRTTAARAWNKRFKLEGFKVRKNGRIIHAVDANQDKVTSPVALLATGAQAPPGVATWVNRETLIPLPYSALGLF